MSEKKDPRAEEYAKQLSELVIKFPTRGEYDRMRVMQLEQEVETLKAELAALRSPAPAATVTVDASQLASDIFNMLDGRGVVMPPPIVLAIESLIRRRLSQPAQAVTGDWAVNAMKRIDSIPKPARESWSVLSWEEYYKECARIIQACYPQPALTDAGRAVVEAITEWINNVDQYHQRDKDGFCLVGDDDLDLLRAAVAAVRGAGGEKG